MLSFAATADAKRNCGEGAKQPGYHLNAPARDPMRDKGRRRQKKNALERRFMR